MNWHRKCTIHIVLTCFHLLNSTLELLSFWTPTWMTSGWGTVHSNTLSYKLRICNSCISKLAAQRGMLMQAPCTHQWWSCVTLLLNIAACCGQDSVTRNWLHNSMSLISHCLFPVLWLNIYDAVLETNRSRVQIPAPLLSNATLGKLLKHVPLSPSTIIWYLPLGSDALWVGR